MKSVLTRHGRGASSGAGSGAQLVGAGWVVHTNYVAHEI